MDNAMQHHIVVDPINIDFEHGSQLFEYWEMKRGDRSRPCWTDLDLMDIYRIAPYMTVKDVIDDGMEFINRFYGSGLTTILGFDNTGKSLSEAYSSEAYDLIINVCRKAFNSLKPLQSNGPIVWAENKEYRNYSCLYLPLDSANGLPAHLISVFDFDVH